MKKYSEIIDLLLEFKEEALEILPEIPGDFDRESKFTIIKILSDIKNEKSIGVLNKFLYDKDGQIRMAAAKSIEKMGDTAIRSAIYTLDNIDEYKGRDLEKTLIKVIGQKKFKKLRREKRFIDLLSVHVSQAKKIKALDEIAGFDIEERKEFLESALGENDIALKIKAIEMLLRLKSLKAIKSAEELIFSGDSELSDIAFNLILSCSSEEALPLMVKCFNSSFRKIEAFEFICRFNNKVSDFDVYISKALSDEDFFLREKAILFLGEFDRCDKAIG